ncbi:hypothetical protein Bca101_067702 [Brassica carinata]
MPSSTRNNKETQLIFSEDHASLKRSICKQKRSALININTSLSFDTRSSPSIDTTLPSTDIFHPTSINTAEENGDLRDLEGHMRNAAGQKSDAQGNVIPEPDTVASRAAEPVDGAAQTRTLADYNRPDQFYANQSAIRPPAIYKGDFELKPQY